MTFTPPRSLLRGNSHNYALMNFTRRDDPTDVTLFGFRLPWFQRPPVWTPTQQSAFIESLYLGFPFGMIVSTHGDEHPPEHQHLLLDGQQRLTAVRAFLRGEIPAFGTFIHEYRPAAVDRLLDIPTSGTHLIEPLTDEQLLDLYLRLSFGGTPHRPEDHPLHPNFQTRQSG